MRYIPTPEKVEVPNPFPKKYPYSHTYVYDYYRVHMRAMNASENGLDEHFDSILGSQTHSLGQHGPNKYYLTILTMFKNEGEGLEGLEVH